MDNLPRSLRCALLTICLVVLGWPVRAQETHALHFRGDWNYPPYEFLDEDGNPTGFNVELLKKVCQTMGLDCRVTLGPWNEVRTQLENGTIHGITGMLYSAGRDQKVDFTTYHSIVSHSIFVPTTSSIRGVKDLIDKSIGVQRGDLMHDYVLQHGLSSMIFGYADQQEVLKSLAENKVDCALVARIQGMYVMNELGIHDIMPVGDPILPRKYCFAVREGDDVLRSQLNEGMNVLKETGEYKAIYDRWFSPYTEQNIQKKVIVILTWTLVPVGFILTTVFLWTYFLKRQVREKTQSLHKELRERRRMEKALVESEGNYRRVFYNAATCMILVDGETNILMANHKCLQAFGYDQEDSIQGMRLTDLIANSQLQEMVEKCLTDGEFHFEWETTIRTSGGAAKDVVVSIGSVPEKNRCILSLLDVSMIKEAERERKRLEEELAHARKMEAVGTLAGGIAHDFNNLLQTISGNLYFLQKKAAENSNTDKYLRDTEYSVNRARELVRHLMTFSRKMEPRMEIIDVHEIIRRGLDLLQRTVPKMITLKTQFTHEQCTIKADPGQIEQVLLNLVQNASDALEGSGQVLIQTALLQVDKPHPMMDGSILEPGCYVRIQVLDNGHGMPPEVVEHIFEPFFTTKDVGKGTGLGLSSVYGIVKAHRGHIQCTSVVDQGTAMSLYFPCAASLESESGNTERITEAHQDTVPGKATILLVDDEAMIKELTREFLEEHGHTVLTAGSGEEALQIHAQTANNIDLTIIDLGMPGMGGEQCIKSLLHQHPEARILVASGYSGHPMARDPLSYGVRGFVSKPYKFEELTQQIDKVFGSREGTKTRNN
jgi:PAS domain S-box-containing protein